MGVSAREDDNIEASILSVTWPSMNEGGKLTSWGQTDENVNCDIADPTIGATYTLVVDIDIELKDGIKAVEYKPYVMVRDRFYLPPFETIYGSSATSETEAGTWKWETTSQHTWLCWNSIQREVDFLAYSRALQPIEATVDLNPNTLNVKSKAKFVTCYIELPWGYNAEDIDASSVSLTKLNGQLLDAPLHAVGPSEIGDYDKDGIQDLMVEFDMQALLRLLEVGEARLTLEGYLKDTTPFKGVSFVVCKASTLITITLSRDSLDLGQSINVSGTVSPSPGQVEIELLYTRPDRSTVTRSATTSVGGVFSDTYTPDKDGQWTIICSWPGNENYAEATSSPISFSMKQPFPTMFAIMVILAIGIIGFVLIVKRRYKATRRDLIQGFHTDRHLNRSWKKAIEYGKAQGIPEIELGLSTD